MVISYCSPAVNVESKHTLGIKACYDQKESKVACASSAREVQARPDDDNTAARWYDQSSPVE
jgi:hypothetical protein